jgi:hypothetical protein
MGKRSYSLWTEDDIYILDKMYKQNIPTDVIAKGLQRTTRSVDHAIKNIILQKIINNGTDSAITEYDLYEDEVYEDLVPGKYNIVNEEVQRNSFGTCLFIYILCISSSIIIGNYLTWKY